MDLINEILDQAVKEFKKIPVTSKAIVKDEIKLPSKSDLTYVSFPITFDINTGPFRIVDGQMTTCQIFVVSQPYSDVSLIFAGKYLWKTSINFTFDHNVIYK